MEHIYLYSFWDLYTSFCMLYLYTDLIVEVATLALLYHLETILFATYKTMYCDSKDIL